MNARMTSRWLKGASLVMTVALGACSGSNADACGGIVAPTRLLTPSPSALALDIGTTGQVILNLTGGCPDDDLRVTWQSGNAAVATVAADGTVTAVGAGTATLTATAFNNTTRTSLIVTVRARTATTLTTTPAADTLSPLGTKALTATVRDQNGAALTTAPIVWRSLSPALASVSGAGTVTAIASGTATIEASSPRTTAADSLRDTVRILIVPACNLIRQVILGTTVTASFDASSCRSLFGYAIANQYSVASLTQAYYSIRVTSTVATTLVPLNIGASLYGLPPSDTATTAFVVIRPGNFGFLVAAPATTPGSYTVVTALDPDPRTRCVPTDITLGVTFNTGVTPTCLSRDIRILPSLPVGQAVSVTAAAPTYPVTIELRNFTSGALIQRSQAGSAGGNASLSVIITAANPLVFVRVLGAAGVTDLVSLRF